jgi:hypothetical protein
MIAWSAGVKPTRPSEMSPKIQRMTAKRPILYKSQVPLTSKHTGATLKAEKQVYSWRSIEVRFRFAFTPNANFALPGNPHSHVPGVAVASTFPKILLAIAPGRFGLGFSSFIGITLNGIDISQTGKLRLVGHILTPRQSKDTKAP